MVHRNVEINYFHPLVAVANGRFIGRHRDYEEPGLLVAIGIPRTFPDAARPPQFLNMQFLREVTFDCGSLTACHAIGRFPGLTLQIRT